MTFSHTVCDGFDNEIDNDNLHNVYEEIGCKTCQVQTDIF